MLQGSKIDCGAPSRFLPFFARLLPLSPVFTGRRRLRASPGIRNLTAIQAPMVLDRTARSPKGNHLKPRAGDETSDDGLPSRMSRKRQSEAGPSEAVFGTLTADRCCHEGRVKPSMTSRMGPSGRVGKVRNGRSHSALRGRTEANHRDRFVKSGIGGRACAITVGKRSSRNREALGEIPAPTVFWGWFRGLMPANAVAVRPPLPCRLPHRSNRVMSVPASASS